jgi:DNA ligase-1
MSFDDLSAYFERLEAAAGRLEMYRLLGELFYKANPDEAAEIAYLCEARLLPASANPEVGVGERMAAASIAVATGKAPQKINSLYRRLGDLGLVAEELLPSRRTSNLTVSAVYAALLEIARTSGAGSVGKKVDQLASLMTRASSRGACYIVRFAVGRLRLGVGAPTIIEAIARRQADGKEARELIERAYNLRSDLGLVIRTLRERGPAAIKRFKASVGHPVRMMLAERLPGAEAIIARLGRCAVESKLDGFRCQVHVRDHEVEIFSRNLERTTAMFPDLVAAVRAQVKARSAIIEGEAAAVNEATGEFHPFQVTAQRKRKHGVEEMASEFPLALIAFDLLYANGKDYTNEEYESRRATLERIIKPAPNGRIRLVERVVTDRAQELQRFFDEQVERGLEGVVAKRLDAPYSAGARNFNWIKLKRVYRGELSDTIDAVVVGYLRGRGMRARLGIGALLAAVYDAGTDTFQTIAKIGGGLSEEQWIKLRESLDKTKVQARPARVDSRLTPDVWTEPKYVVNVLADEITRSPIHTCAQNEEGIGLALRFPRLVGFIRKDKSPEDATTVKEIKEMFAMQKKRRKR